MALKGYVICIHNNQWWLGCVLEKDLENVQVKLSLLHPSGPSRSCWYPRTPEIVTVPLFRVVLLVEPRTTTGRTYTIPQNVSKATSAILKDTTSTWSEFLYNIFHYFAYVSGIKCLIYPEPILIPKPNLCGAKRNNSTMFWPSMKKFEMSRTGGKRILINKLIKAPSQLWSTHPLSTPKYSWEHEL